MDRLTKEQRHHCMASIRGKDTKPEILVRKFLFSRGFRYRLNHPRLPGHPDLVLRKYRTVVFVNGCFCHGVKFHVTVPPCLYKLRQKQLLKTIRYELISTPTYLGRTKDKHNLYLARSLKTRQSFLSIWGK